MEEEVRAFLEELKGLRPGAPQEPVAARREYEQGEERTREYGGDLMDMLHALRHYKKAVEQDARFAAPYGGIGTCILRAGYFSGDKYDRAAIKHALEWIDRGLAIDATDVRCLESKASVLRFAGRDAEAEKLARELIRTHQRRPMPRSLLADLLLRRKKYAEALEMARQALSLAPAKGRERLPLLEAVAEIYQEAGRYDEGSAAFEAALGEFPESAWTWHNASICLLRAKRYERAFECSNKALGLMEFGAAREVNKYLAREMESLGKIGPATYHWLRGPP